MHPLPQMPAMNLSSQHTFALMYAGARELAIAEKSGDAQRLGKLDFSVLPCCIRCMGPCLVNPATPQWKPFRCGRCKSAIYCSKKCQIADWTPGTALSTPHKVLCPRNVEHMKRVPEFQAVFKQFPWARIESDGTSSHQLLKARLGVLGSGQSFGYWSIPGGCMPHDPSTMAIGPSHLIFDTDIGRQKSYMHGMMLLSEKWPTEKNAWMLKNQEHIPRLKFDQKLQAPTRPHPGEINDWASWYKWRGLDLESPAALLMDGPLSVYHLLANVLKVVEVNAMSSDRRVLRVSCLGTEVELNFLPLFSELALLLPNTEIIITFFGKAVHDLVSLAKSQYPRSLAVRDIVWSYTAPEKTGGGSVAIKLHSKAESWTREILVSGEAEDDPHALVALNAGLLSYTSWEDPIIISACANILFAITEYSEQSLELAAQELPNMQFRAILQKVHSQGFRWSASSQDHTIASNPFHRPGQRGLGVTRVPNYFNGFTMPVTLKDTPSDVTAKKSG